MPTYRVAGLLLTTELSLPDLPLAEEHERGGPGHWELVATPDLVVPPTELVFETPLPGGRVWSQVASADGLLLLRFPERADFLVDLDARTVALATVPGLADSTLTHLVIDQLIPHLLATGGDLVLHASGVVVDGTAVAFLGPSGAGKSSLAAGFARNGAAVLTDDYLVLTDDGDRYLTTVAYAGLRLWEDSTAHFAAGAATTGVADYTTKRRLTVDGHDPRAVVPLGAIVVLGRAPDADAPDVAIGRLGGRDAFQVVFAQAFRVERPGATGQVAELDRFVRLTESVPVFLMEHRRDYALLPAVLDAVTGALRDGAPLSR